MFNATFKIGEYVYAINVYSSTLDDNGSLYQAVLTDRSIMVIEAKTMNLVSFDPNSIIMNEFFKDYGIEKEQDKPYMLISKKRND